jgi:dipeptide/tripeptide permease
MIASDLIWKHLLSIKPSIINLQSLIFASMGSIFSTFRQFPRTFWVANTMELFERWAWYGMFLVLPLYLTGSTDTGALGFSQAQKGVLTGTVVMILYFLPTITGAIADRYGYKRVLVMAYLIMAAGYYLMGIVESYAMLWAVFLLLGIGAGLFKPVISATVRKTTDDKTASIGFGIFYMIVNIGAFVGPVFAAKLREESWQWVFIMSSAVILFNLLLLILFYKEPQAERIPEPLGKSLARIFRNIGLALSDFKLLLFLVIIIGFWTMYNQLFYTLPVFIEQWLDTSPIYDALGGISPALASAIGTGKGTIAPEMLTNIDALYIVIFQVMVSGMVMKFRPVSTMVTGFLICSLGIGLWFVFLNPFFLFISLLVFAFGEMAGSPKILEYIGRIAPEDKVALYMGCYFIPLAGGNFLAGLLSGNVYGRISDKAALLQREVAERGIPLPGISESFSQNDFFNAAAGAMQMTPRELTVYLWDKYDPSQIWMVFSGIGILTVAALFLYDRFLLNPGPGPGKSA